MKQGVRRRRGWGTGEIWVTYYVPSDSLWARDNLLMSIPVVYLGMYSPRLALGRSKLYMAQVRTDYIIV